MIAPAIPKMSYKGMSIHQLYPPLQLQKINKTNKQTNKQTSKQANKQTMPYHLPVL
jgi:hypothetical protein